LIGRKREVVKELDVVLDHQCRYFFVRHAFPDIEVRLGDGHLLGRLTDLNSGPVLKPREHRLRINEVRVF
jgi:hypothetical protein